MELMFLLGIAAFGATASSVGLSRGGAMGGGERCSAPCRCSASWPCRSPSRRPAGYRPASRPAWQPRRAADPQRLHAARDGPLGARRRAGRVVAWLAGGLAGFRGLIPPSSPSIAAARLPCPHEPRTRHRRGWVDGVRLAARPARVPRPGGIPAAARGCGAMLATVCSWPRSSSRRSRPTRGAGPPTGATSPATGTGVESATALVGILVLAVALAVALRIGAVLPPSGSAADGRRPADRCRCCSRGCRCRSRCRARGGRPARRAARPAPRRNR